MPVPKGQQEKYGILVATFMSRDGLSHDEAKKKADKAIKGAKKREKEKKEKQKS